MKRLINWINYYIREKWDRESEDLSVMESNDTVSLGVQIILDIPIELTVRFPDYVDDRKGGILVQYILKVYFIPYLERLGINKKLRKALKKQSKKALKVLTKEIESGKYNRG